ncbi:MAG: NAD(P)-dependent oxidoreductase [Asticcacaulis sp.]|nr:NAD(P)-dependent oxidoreductase [Asticcacaulis sp.]
MGKRIVFTGGSGKAGRHVIPYLLASGHAVVNLDLTPFGDGINTLLTDLTDSGQVFNALSMHFGFEGLDTGQGPAPVDAVVHFAATARILIRPDNVTFAANAVSTYNVIEAAAKLGIKKVIIASSETTYGVCFAEGDHDYHEFPLTEDYDVDPMDSYGLSKVVNEKTARAFAHWLPGLQRRQRHHNGAGANARLFKALGTQHPDHRRYRRFRRPHQQPQDPRPAGLPRGTRLAEIRESLMSNRRP